MSIQGAGIQFLMAQPTTAAHFVPGLKSIGKYITLILNRLTRIGIGHSTLKDE